MNAGYSGLFLFQAFQTHMWNFNLFWLISDRKKIEIITLPVWGYNTGEGVPDSVRGIGMSEGCNYPARLEQCPAVELYVCNGVFKSRENISAVLCDKLPVQLSRQKCGHWVLHQPTTGSGHGTIIGHQRVTGSVLNTEYLSTSKYFLLNGSNKNKNEAVVLDYQASLL